ncbi:hypothetical protein Rta_28490 [Ramlibacter tataouinensis TTB310]|uniref:Toxin CptA n=1 Tax=Ramlibacter tataouinensis (strain ATCC BAA-407 / DSM 14655 / LMG 21543 / TTB310) TaxID=365046 RepID=F5Y5R8_RAMTT|nr:hypothetical protein Rta_28490 [Ramlibacter tataouinensis TTB310]
MLLLVWTCAAVAQVAWLAVVPGWRPALGLALVAGLGGWALTAWRAGPRGELSWDGGGWTWQEEGAAVPVQARLEVGLDLQWALLLRMSALGEGPHRLPSWLWLERGMRAAHWDALRRAVYSRARPDAPPASASSAAKP